MSYSGPIHDRITAHNERILETRRCALVCAGTKQATYWQVGGGWSIDERKAMIADKAVMSKIMCDVTLGTGLWASTRLVRIGEDNFFPTSFGQ